MKSCKRGVQCSFYILGADKQDYEYRTSLTHIFRQIGLSLLNLNPQPSLKYFKHKKDKNTKIRKGNTQNLPHPHIPPDWPLPQIFYAQKDKKTHKDKQRHTKIREGNTQNLPHPHIPPDCPISLEFESTPPSNVHHPPPKN